MKKTARMIRGIIAWGLITTLLIVYLSYNYLLLPILEEHGLVFAERLSSEVLLYIVASLLFTLAIGWLIRNKFWLGLDYAWKHYFIVKSIRKQLKQARVAQEQEFENNIVDIPKIKLVFDDKKKRSQGKVFIENSIRFDMKLEDIRIDASLNDYIVEKQYITLDRKWYVFEFINVKSLNQENFETKEKYLNWSKEKSDDYSLRLDDRSIIPIHHMGLSGQTGSGKTFLLQMIIEQLEDKNVKHKLYVIDPKRADLYFLAKNLLPANQVADVTGAIEMIKSFETIIDGRQAELESFFMQNKNATYQDADLPAIILLIDEYGALRADLQRLPKAERDEVDAVLSKIAFMGRQIGIVLWVCTQQMNANTLPTAIRDQLVIKIVLGTSDDQTYRTMFSPSVDIPNMLFEAGEGLISAPSIASAEKPRLLFVPFLMYLKSNASVAGEAREASRAVAKVNTTAPIEQKNDQVLHVSTLLERKDGKND